MSGDESSNFTSMKDIIEENIEELIEKDRDWGVLKDWQALMLAQRQNYFYDRRYGLGAEYHNNPSQWDTIIEREWQVMEQRYKCGIGVTEEILETFGADFFDSKMEFDKELISIISGLESKTINSQSLLIYTFEDFTLLSNQGIFRDEVFIIDPQRKWKSKVRDILRQYGYQNFEELSIEGRKCIVVTRK